MSQAQLDQPSLFSQIQQMLQPLAATRPLGVEAVLAIAKQPELAWLTADIVKLWEHFDTEPMVHHALLLAAECHGGHDYAHVSGLIPYLAHLVDVSRCVAFNLAITDPLAAVCALWHDMIEDEKISEEELRAYIEQNPAFCLGQEPRSTSDQVIVILKALIRPGSYDAGAYYSGLIQAPPTTRLVKASDLICNTSTLRAFHQAKHVDGQEDLGFRDHWIPKYTTEAAAYVLQKPAFTSLDAYPRIHNTLLGILQELLEYLLTEHPDQIAELEQVSLDKYGASFRAAIRQLQEMPYL